MKRFAGYLSGFTGSLLLLFLMPFAILPGYFFMGIVFGGLGLLLLWLAWRWKISVRSLCLFLVTSALLALFMYGLTSRGVGFFHSRNGVDMDGVTTVEDAITNCRATGLLGWDLVAYAENLTASKFTYSHKNLWDSPSTAFKYGQGYCLQQALALKDIYDGLGVECRVVYASRCRFPAERKEGFLTPTYTVGHAWLQVQVDGNKLDVCTSNIENAPGRLNFEVLSEVRNMPPPLRPLANIALALDNILRDPRQR
jgi:energy-coupling factor transporter transmembrane protein EcfT